jgi:hypothetical protein
MKVVSLLLVPRTGRREPKASASAVEQRGNDGGVSAALLGPESLYMSSNMTAGCLHDVVQVR